jgi:cyclic pyranopterin phosphate synthase
MYDRLKRKINYLRISVTDLCNLRCCYCMPAEGVKLMRHDDILSFEEISAVTRQAVALGVDKVRLTGGEPLVRRDILTLVHMLGQIEGIQDYAMTTNGILLPEYASDLKAAGIQRLNISLDTLDPARYRAITRNGQVEHVIAGIDAALQVGFQKIKLNCVIEQSPDETDAQAVAAFGTERGLEVRFIRQMDMAQGRFWRVIGGDGGHCVSCNRLRLSSDGKIFPCLFSDQSYDVRKLGVEDALRLAVAEKPESGHKSSNRFYRIGG